MRKKKAIYFSSSRRIWSRVVQPRILHLWRIFCRYLTYHCQTRFGPSRPPFCAYARSLRVEIVGRCLSLQIVIHTRVPRRVSFGRNPKPRASKTLRRRPWVVRIYESYEYRWSGQFVGCMRRGIIFVSHARGLLKERRARDILTRIVAGISPHIFAVDSGVYVCQFAIRTTYTFLGSTYVFVERSAGFRNL